MTNEPDIIEMEQLFSSEPESSERILFLSVILQALLDATKDKKVNEKIRITYERDRAKSWLFSKVGVTCQDFEDVCDMAGVIVPPNNRIAIRPNNRGFFKCIY